MFITVEGPDGSGKTTALANIKQILEKKGYQVLLTREPGGQKTAEKIRHVILDVNNNDMHPWTEALLYLAARKEHMDKIVQPALKAKKIVISDRYADSTFVYQGFARGLNHKQLKQVHRLVLGPKYLPDLTIFLDISLADQQHRLAKRTKKANRFDLADNAFKEQIIKGYRSLAKSDPKRIKVIDASKSKAAVSADLEKIILDRVKRHAK